MFHEMKVLSHTYLLQILWLMFLSLLMPMALSNRALTTEAENYVTELFKSINPWIMSLNIYIFIYVLNCMIYTAS